MTPIESLRATWTDRIAHSASSLRKIDLSSVYPTRCSFQVYSDGGYHQQTKRGASSALILKNGEFYKKSKKSGDCSSSNIAELEAALLGIREIPEGASAQMNTDSQFVLFAAELCKNDELLKRWVGKKNREPFEGLLLEFAREIEKRELYWKLRSRKNRFIKWCHNCCREEMNGAGEVWWNEEHN